MHPADDAGAAFVGPTGGRARRHLLRRIPAGLSRGRSLMEMNYDMLKSRIADRAAELLEYREREILRYALRADRRLRLHAGRGRQDFFRDAGARTADRDQGGAGVAASGAGAAAQRILGRIATCAQQAGHVMAAHGAVGDMERWRGWWRRGRWRAFEGTLATPVANSSKRQYSQAPPARAETICRYVSACGMFLSLRRLRSHPNGYGHGRGRPCGRFAYPMTSCHGFESSLNAVSCSALATSRPPRLPCQD